MSGYILALDQGTTSSRSILVGEQGNIVALEQQEFVQRYPHPGWVEHDPEDIWQSQLASAQRLIARNRNRSGTDSKSIIAIGITNQRETTIIWDRSSGVPIANAIVWQDRRTADLCADLRSAGMSEQVRSITGLPIDPYFSASKITWLLDSIPGARERAECGELAFGTVDSYLLWRMTAGRVHATDISNASRTMLCDLHMGDWSEEMLALFRIPRALLPSINPSCHYYGDTEPDLFGRPIPICGVAGDQQAATFGQACHKPGMVKNTYGTGSFLLMNTGHRPHASSHGLITTTAWDLGGLDREGCAGRSFALEGSIFVTGAAVQWLRDELQIIRSADEIEALASSVPDTGGVCFVPAFVGLGAPHWDADARGAILGLTRGVGRAHIARAVLEAACFQTSDVLTAMQADCGLVVPELRVDGGMTANSTLLQMQADILGIPVLRPSNTETTALGAAYLAGLQAGFWNDLGQLARLWRQEAVFEPRISPDQRSGMLGQWHDAVRRVRTQEA